MTRTQLTARTIRYWDSEGLLCDVKRSVGYTRFFTENDITRIREIKRLKKKGYKIAQIKTLFEEKYPKKMTKSFSDIELSDVFVSESDIALCQSIDINVLGTEFQDGQTVVPYLQSRHLTSEFIKKAVLKQSKKPSASKVQCPTIPKKGAWVGNTGRSIMNFIRKKHDTQECTIDSLTSSLNRAVEWLILPLSVSTDFLYQNSNEPFVMLYTKTAARQFHNIYKQADVMEVLLKQLREEMMPFNRVMNQVTITCTSDAVHKQWIKGVQSEVSNPDLLDIEPITPFYINQSQSEQSFYISVI